jgi:hypothetical protein
MVLRIRAMKLHEAGMIEMFLVNAESLTLSSNIVKVFVRDCKDELTFPNPVQIKKKELPAPSYRMSGVITLTGNHGFQFTPQALPAIVS